MAVLASSVASASVAVGGGCRASARFSGKNTSSAARRAPRLQANRTVFAAQSAKAVPKVELMMTPKPICLKASDPIEDAVELFIAKGYGHAPVIDDEGKIAGVLSESDLLFGRGLVSKYEDDMVDRKVNAKVCGDAMTSEVVVVNPGTPFDDAAHEMLTRKIHCLPVVDDSMVVVGIVTRKDILRLNWRDLPMFGN